MCFETMCWYEFVCLLPMIAKVSNIGGEGRTYEAFILGLFSLQDARIVM